MYMYIGTSSFLKPCKVGTAKRSPGSNLQHMDYKSSDITTAPRRLRGCVCVMYLWRAKPEFLTPFLYVLRISDVCVALLACRRHAMYVTVCCCGVSVTY